MSVQLTLEAHDVWFFHNSRPFGAAEVASGTGEAEIIPPPSAVFGAVRTAIGEASGIDWTSYRANWKNHALLGPPSPSYLKPGEDWPLTAVKLLGCLPAEVKGQDSWPLFPLPNFVLIHKDAGEAPPLRGIQKLVRLSRSTPMPDIAFSGDEGGLRPVLPAPGAGEVFPGESRSLLMSPP